MRFKTMLKLLVLLCALLAAPLHSHAIVVWGGDSSESEMGDIIIYNDTDAKVKLTADSDWGHRDLLNEPNPMPAHSAKADLDCNLRHEDDNKGTLYFTIKDDQGEYKFYTWAHTAAHGMTWFTLRSDQDFQSEGISSSGAVGIVDSSSDENQRVSQLYRAAFGDSPGYVVTLYACANKDRSGNKYTGNTKIILNISRNDPGRFNLQRVSSSDPPWWNARYDD